MLAKIIRATLLSAALLMYAGCSVDMSAIFDHPDQIKPGNSFPVKLGNIYMYMTNGSEAMFAAIRDSLHVLIGTPEGWEVEEVKFYIADHWKIITMSQDVMDSTELLRMLEDSLAVFETRAEAMSGGVSDPVPLAGQIFEASSMDGSETDSVEVDEVAQWYAFGAPANILIQPGRRMDTVFVVADSLIDTVDTTTPVSIDTLGMTAIPITIYARLKAASTNGTDTLYYYTKTGALPTNEPVDTTDMMAMLAAADLGSMSYAVIEVTPDAAARETAGRSMVLRAGPYPNPFTDKVTLELAEDMGTLGGAQVYSIRGDLIAGLEPRGGRIVWDGVCSDGSRAAPGAYYVRVRHENGVFSAKVNLAR
jgi:hypothetical protein